MVRNLCHGHGRGLDVALHLVLYLADAEREVVLGVGNIGVVFVGNIGFVFVGRCGRCGDLGGEEKLDWEEEEEEEEWIQVESDICMGSKEQLVQVLTQSGYEILYTDATLARSINEKGKKEYYLGTVIA